MLLLFFILIRQITYAATITLSKEIVPLEQVDIYIAGFYLLQCIAAPFQASYSDHCCRRNSLVFGFMMIVIGHIFLFLGLEFGVPFYIVSLIINGALGNIFPIAIAGLVETKFSKNPRITMGFATCMVALAWIIYYYCIQNFPFLLIFWSITLLAALCSALALTCFQDNRDQEPATPYSIKNEILSVKNTLNTRWFLLMIKAYFLTDVAFYFYYYYPISKLNELDIAIIINTIAGGYILGNFLQMFMKTKDTSGFKIGVSLSVFATAVLLVCDYYGKDLGSHLCMVFTLLLAIGYGIFDPCIYSYISKGQSEHKQGKIFGLIDSADNFAETITGLTLLFWTQLSLTKVHFSILLLFLVAIPLLIGSIRAKHLSSLKSGH